MRRTGEFVTLSVFVEHLGVLSPLEEHDREGILSLPVSEKRIPAGGYIAREGTASSTFSVLIDGLAYCQKLACFNARQIVSLAIPGDALDLPNLFLAAADHDIRALTDCETAVVHSELLRELAQRRPAVARAFMVKALVESSVSREWSLNIIRRDARTRIAHLLCEHMVRTRARGLTTGDIMYFPLTQEQLGDATGLTAVHVNRMLRSLEADNLIEKRKGSQIRIPCVDTLRMAGDFSARYLHLRASTEAQNQ